MWRATIRFSSVGITQAEGADPAREITAHRGVGGLIDSDADPARALADAGADLPGVLADAAGEYQGIQSTERGDQRAEFASDAIHEQIDGLAGGRRSLASNARMSPERPGHPRRPERW